MNIYPKISKILTEIEENKVSFKNAIYKYVDYNTDIHFKKIYKLVIEILKHKNTLNLILNEFFESQGIVINDRHFFMALIYEKFFSNQKKKNIGGKLMKVIKDKEELIIQFIKNNKLEFTDKKDNSDSNMDFRINNQNLNENITNFLKQNEVNIIKDEIIEGLFHVNKSHSNQEIIKQIFNFKQTSNIIMQSKSSCLPAFLLKKVVQLDDIINNEKFDVLDSCSAPGNKTLQLSEYFKKSKIYAFELNEKRFELLNQNVKQFNSFNNILTLNEDFLKSDPNDAKFKNVKIILADPSCSGSGTSHNSLIDYQNGDKNLIDEECVINLAGSYVEKDQIERLNQLAKFQIKILNHSMKFTNVKYISYSTCSIFMTENEFVVNSVLKKNSKFELVEIFNLDKKFSDFHEGVTEETKNTLRVCRKCNNIDGFYVAIFKRK